MRDYLSMKNILYKGIIVDPSPELVSHIMVAPTNFTNSMVSDEDFDFLQDYCHDGYTATIELKGRSAIARSLKCLNLHSDDVITILTTSGNSYVSGCVTNEIEKACKWNREINKDTKAIFVVHEFGYSYQELTSLKLYDLPIIEDCAHSFFSKANGIGTVGDYIIYSLSKPFNIQMGAILVSKSHLETVIPKEEERWIRQRIVAQYMRRDAIIKQRLENYHYLEKRLRPMGITPFFQLRDKTVPGVFLFNWAEDIDYADLKEFMNSNGVESSVFYGKNAYFVPCHHCLSVYELDYICTLLEYYYKKHFINHE